VTNLVLDYMTNAVLPALEAQAAQGAKHNFVGTYESESESESESTSTSTLNSSLTIAFNKSTVVGGTEDSASVGFQASIYPQTNSYAAAAATAAGIPGVTGPFTGQWSTNFDWLTADTVHYDGVGMNLFVFDLDATGSATGVTPAAMKVKLERT
jgi:hypothetical protein